MFRKRSTALELLDGDAIPSADLFQNLKELDRINTLLGGYAISIDALKKVLPNSKNSPIVFVDIGCGGGDTLKYIAQWNEQNKAPLSLVGVDIKPVCIDYAHTNRPNPALRFICDDYRNVHLHLPKIHILHACLFCHHLSNAQIIELIQYAQKHKITLIINDLERNPIAYYSIKILTRLFSKSYLVKNDACLSVLRGFKRKEWLDLLKAAGVTSFSLRWKWAFRHQIIIYGDE